MSQALQSEIVKLVDRITKDSDVSKIYLFGSYAYGTPNHDSDVDLCIIINQENKRKREVLKAIRRSISLVATMPVDILIYNKEEFHNRANLSSTLEHKIASEGEVIYEQ